MTWLVQFAGVWVGETLKIYSSGLNRSKKENEKKLKKDREQTEKQNFLALGDVVRSSNKIFMGSQSCFSFANRKKTWRWNGREIDYEYIYIRGEMDSNRYEISFRLKISLRWSVSSLLVLTLIEVKWNSKQYGFNICYFDRNEISNRQEIFVWT